MARKMPILRVAGPTVLVSLLLLGACTASAIFLYRLHASSTQVLSEDLDSLKVAEQIETKLGSLKTKLRAGNFLVEPIHQEIQELLFHASELVNDEKEQEFETQVETQFSEYLSLWHQRAEEVGKAREETTRQMIKKLDDTFTAALRLFNYNKPAIERSEKALKDSMRWLAWGLAIVGCVGSLGGIVLGFGVARALRHSIYKLSVRIRDAADRLGQDLPTVTISEAEGIDYLHDQMHQLVGDIDQVVARLHQREREVLRAEQMAAVGQLAAGVAHELRNPLTAVKMLIQMSREDFENRGLPSEDLQIIENEIRRLERSLQTFLDFARPPKMARRLLDLSAVIGEALDLIAGRARKQGVEVRFVRPEAPVHLEADGEQIRQLVINLSMNALDMMPEGGVLTAEVERGAQEAKVRVSDTGAGIAASVLPRLFEPFVSSKETGLGLGLVVSRRIAEEHGGHLSGANRDSGGACFTLELPSSRSALAEKL